MTKLVHTSDTQIKNWVYGGINPITGLNRRFEDALECLDYVIDYAIKVKAQYFVHAGDVNEERNPDSIAIEEFAKRIARLVKAGIRVVMIAGNHDIDSSIGCTTSISYLKALQIPNLYIADKAVEVFEFDDIGQPIRFLCLPYFYKSQFNMATHEDVSDYIQKTVADFHKKYTEDEFVNVCVSHYTVDKVFEGLDVNEPVIPLSTYEDFDYNAFGHIHAYADYSSLGVIGGYCGSPYRVTHGEKEDKYFNLVDFKEGTLDKHLIPNREFVDIEIDAVDADHEMLDQFIVNKLAHMELDNKFLKITIKCFEKFNLRSIYQHLESREIFHYAPISFDQQYIQTKDRLKFDPTIGSIDVVVDFLGKQRDIDDEFRAKVKTEIESAILAVGI